MWFCDRLHKASAGQLYRFYGLVQYIAATGLTAAGVASSGPATLCLGLRTDLDNYCCNPLKRLLKSEEARKVVYSVGDWQYVYQLVARIVCSAAGHSP